LKVNAHPHAALEHDAISGWMDGDDDEDWSARDSNFHTHIQTSKDEEGDQLMFVDKENEEDLFEREK
jgi:hypothetical protein